MFSFQIHFKLPSKKIKDPQLIIWSLSILRLLSRVLRVSLSPVSLLISSASAACFPCSSSSVALRASRFNPASSCCTLAITSRAPSTDARVLILPKKALARCVTPDVASRVSVRFVSVVSNVTCKEIGWKTNQQQSYCHHTHNLLVFQYMEN